MSATVSGNTITWQANDNTIVTLKCGIKALFSTSEVHYRGADDAGAGAAITAPVLTELPDVKGYPNVLIPSAHTDTLTVFIHPSPHINTHYGSDSGHIITGGYNA